MEIYINTHTHTHKCKKEKYNVYTLRFSTRFLLYTHTDTHTLATARALSQRLKTAEDGMRLLLCGAFTQSYYTRISL